MNEPFDPEDDERFGYGWDIGMALRKLPLFLGRRKLSLDDKIALGRQIVGICGRQELFSGRKPPLHGHGRAPDNREG